jgi:hypothetical protein
MCMYLKNLLFPCFFGIISYCSINVILIHKLNSFTGVLTLYARIMLHHIAHLRQQCHNSKLVIFQEKLLKILKFYNFLWVQRRHNCSPAAIFTNCIMTLYVLKVHLQTFLSLPKTQKYQILTSDTLVANEWYVETLPFKLEES